MVSNSHQQVHDFFHPQYDTMELCNSWLEEKLGGLEVGRKIEETCCLVVWNMIFFPYIGNFIIPFGTSTWTQWTQWIQRVVFFVGWHETWLGEAQENAVKKIVPAYQTLPYVAPSLYRLNKNSFVIRWFTLHWIPFLWNSFTSGSNDLDHPETRWNKHQSYQSEDESVHNP